jgi:hypothetical protein
LTRTDRSKKECLGYWKEKERLGKIITFYEEKRDSWLERQNLITYELMVWNGKVCLILQYDATFVA